MTTLGTKLPHWDMTTVFPSLDSNAFTTAFDAIKTEVSDLTSYLDEKNVRKAEAPDIDDATVDTFEELITRLNDLGDQIREVQAYRCNRSTTRRSGTHHRHWYPRQCS